MRRQFNKKFFIVIFLFFAIATLSFLLAQNPHETNAADLSNFNAGNIISDYVMSNYSSMSESEIQAFLKSKNSCDDTRTYLASYYPGYNYHVENGHFVCMADESFDGESAAHIIWQAAQDYQINPQVIIVLLQKEQGLITDTWPNHRQYLSATGYACPDTASCDSKYYGFKNQVRNAAKTFRSVLDGDWTNYSVGWNYILYSPYSGCGGSNIYIENLATAALYRYTPYQPNSEAISAGYGIGNYCSSYGNRNFYSYFSDWFGDPRKTHATIDGEEIEISSGIYYLTSKSNSSYRIDVANKGTGNGTNIWLWNSELTNHQAWLIQKDENYYTITDTYSGKNIDISGAKTDSGTNIQLWEPNDSCAQKWKIYKTTDGYYSFVSACDKNKVIDLNNNSTNNGTNIQLWDINNSDAQKWNIEPEAIIEEGDYIVEAKNNLKKALDVNGAATENGTNIQLWDKNNGSAQIWHIQYNSTTNDYTFINPNSNRALDINGGETSNGTNIQLWDSNLSCAQRWKAILDTDNYYTFVSACDNQKALDINGGETSNGTNIQLWDINSSSAQKWALVPAETIKNGTYQFISKLSSTKALDVNGAYKSNGTNIQLWDKNSSAAQKWKITYNSTTGYYKIINPNSGRALDVSGAHTLSGTNIQIWDNNSSCAQQWRILKKTDGSLKLLSGCNQSLALDVSGASKLNGTNVQLWSNNSSNAQYWAIK